MGPKVICFYKIDLVFDKLYASTLYGIGMWNYHNWSLCIHFPWDWYVELSAWDNKHMGRVNVSIGKIQYNDFVNVNF